MFHHKLSHAHLPRELKSNSIGFKSGLICFLRQGRAGRAVARFPESGYRLRRHKTDISASRAPEAFLYAYKADKSTLQFELTNRSFRCQTKTKTKKADISDDKTYLSALCFQHPIVVSHSWFLETDILAF